MIYLRLIWAYLKIGLFGFGGGYAMLALIEREIVGPGWISGHQLGHIYRLCGSGGVFRGFLLAGFRYFGIGALHAGGRAAVICACGLYKPSDTPP